MEKAKIKTEEEKKKWSDFFEAERKFLDLVNEITEALHVDMPAMYVKPKSETGREKPPEYIRGVYKLKEGKEEEFLSALNDLKRLYNIALGDEKNEKFPRRFAQFYRNVEQINIVINNAVSSVKIKGKGNFPYLQFGGNDKRYSEAQELVELFKKNGIHAFVADPIISTLYLKKEDILKYFNLEEIQAHRLSGYQYRVRMRHLGETKGYRAMYGFIVVDSDSPISVHHSAPQANRPHRYSATLDKIELPSISREGFELQTLWTFYKI